MRAGQPERHPPTCLLPVLVRQESPQERQQQGRPARLAPGLREQGQPVVWLRALRQQVPVQQEAAAQRQRVPRVRVHHRQQVVRPRQRLPQLPMWQRRRPRTQGAPVPSVPCPSRRKSRSWHSAWLFPRAIQRVAPRGLAATALGTRLTGGRLPSSGWPCVTPRPFKATLRSRAVA